MDFNDTPEQAEFRSQVQSWLGANAKLKTPGTRALNRRLVSEKGLDIAREWQAKKADAGYACMTFPSDYGGQNAPVIHQVIYEQEEAKYDVPTGFFSIGLGMCAPTLIEYATEEQKQRFVPPMVRGEEVWCQLFSEPGAGSDLAGLRTSAKRDGDDWIINGQKVWTSGAHYSDYGILVTRHDTDLPKHKGLTFFFLDMKSEGVEVRPIKQISGASDFNEVYFTNVRIPDSQRLGEVGSGWTVSLTTLMNERLAVGGAPAPDATDLLDLARKVQLENGPAIADSGVRDRLATWFVEQQGLKHIRSRSLTALSRGETPGPEASIAKVVSANKLQSVSSFGTDLLEEAGQIIDPEQTVNEGMFQSSFFYAPGLRIAGGSDEILRNIIAERVLRLPGDIRVDRDTAFKDIPTGSH